MSERVTRPRRSCLSVPGSSERFLAKAPTVPADMTFLDLEDAVAPVEKEAARGKVVDAIKNLDWGDRVLCVRVNACSSLSLFCTRNRETAVLSAAWRACSESRTWTRASASKGVRASGGGRVGQDGCRLLEFVCRAGGELFVAHPRRRGKEGWGLRAVTIMR